MHFGGISHVTIREILDIRASRASTFWRTFDFGVVLASDGRDLAYIKAIGTSREEAVSRRSLCSDELQIRTPPGILLGFSYVLRSHQDESMYGDRRVVRAS